MAARTKRIRFTVTMDVDYAPVLESRAAGEGARAVAQHIVDMMDIDGLDVFDGADDFYVASIVDVELAEQ